MDEQQLRAIAAQLRQPHGEYALQVGEMMNTGNLHINRGAIEAVNPSAGDNILEIGMGNGFFVPEILSAHDSIKYTGCDFSEVMVDEARKRNEEYVRNGRAQFLLGDAGKLPFEAETFHKVFSVNTVYFWENQQAVLAEIHRVLKPKGQITLAIRPKSIMEHYPFVKYGFNMFTKDDLADLLRENNFHVTDVVEKDEPEQDIAGEKVRMAMALVSATKQ